jgi:hypothetical protein
MIRVIAIASRPLRMPTAWMSKTAHMVGASVASLRARTSKLFDGYHPEQHYMRGPGPKWRAKHPETVGLPE